MDSKRIALLLVLVFLCTSVVKGQSEITSSSGFVANDEVSLLFSAGDAIVGDFENASIKLSLVNIPDLKIIPTSTERAFDLPKEFGLNQNYPNPFNPSTTISYAMPKAADISIDVFDILGKKVASLVNERKNAGNHTIQFQASNLASGVYFYTLRVEGKVLKSQKMLLIK